MYFGSDDLLRVRDLSIYMSTPTGEVQIVDGVNLQVASGAALGLIGESGSGKSLTAMAILRLLPAAARVEGEILFRGVDILKLRSEELKAIRGSQISMIFQEPMTALDPVFTVGYQLSATLRAHHDVSRRVARTRSIEMLQSVGIPDPTRRFDAYAHELSGGMRQRVMIAMALIAEPELLIADEPTTAVDITIQAQLLALLAQLSAERGTAIILISHDIAVVAELCSEVSVMYAGQIVESTTTDTILVSPAHPYTSGLVRAAPRMENSGTRLEGIPGRVPMPAEYPAGCRFQARCAHAMTHCGEPQPLVGHIAFQPQRHSVRCCRHGELDLPGVVVADPEAVRSP
ncbi:peptide/nickel transport system ATP-binding protein [Antricoccus suffuscus]|uniref:Peptide/nickel transport system ATP-binding protein n=2 Tax=Antricoccus suffuscus TaxID=1629062 RepID=A0A2T0ZTQ9_9ACTN|nr:peptide/nickel transport system ATP-binding protein [Antricoccus suffuscus]